MKQWPKQVTFQEVEFNTFDFWVQVYNLLPDKMNENSARTIGDFVGSFVSPQLKGNSRLKQGTFIRIRSSLDITKPLKIRFLMTREQQPTM